MPPLGTAARTPMPSTTRSIPTTKAPLESRAGTGRVPPPPPWSQATRYDYAGEGLPLPRSEALRRPGICARICHPNPWFSHSTNDMLAFVDVHASHASPFDVTASDFKRGIPKEMSRESAAETAYARSYEGPTPGSGDRPYAFAFMTTHWFRHTITLPHRFHHGTYDPLLVQSCYLLRVYSWSLSTICRQRADFGRPLPSRGGRNDRACLWDLRSAAMARILATSRRLYLFFQPKAASSQVRSSSGQVFGAPATPPAHEH